MITRYDLTDWSVPNTQYYWVYRTVKSAIHRCGPTAKDGFKRDYYNRGIRVCPDWIKDFKAFGLYILNELGDRPEGYSLDRIDNDKGYEPGNLRWATPLMQQRNTRLIPQSLRG